MSERLPCITFQIDVDVDTFFRRVQQVADDMGKFYIDQGKFPLPNDIKSVDLRVYESNKHKNVMVRFYHSSKYPKRIRVEVSAERWAPENPTYDDYVSAFHDAMCDFPSRYEKIFGSRLAFEIEKKSAQ